MPKRRDEYVVGRPTISFLRVHCRLFGIHRPAEEPGTHALGQCYHRVQPLPDRGLTRTGEELRTQYGLADYGQLLVCRGGSTAT